MADDSYLSIAAIAGDESMTERLNACATQQQQLGSVDIGALWGRPPGSAVSWVADNRYLWASSPGWGAAWDYAIAAGNENPGKDPSVITDEMILAAVQALAPLPPEPEPPALAAAFTFTPPDPAVDADVTFDASSSTGDIAAYAWDFGDGTTDTGQTATHAYTTAGDQTVTLTVTAGDDTTAQTEQTVTVT